MRTLLLVLMAVVLSIALPASLDYFGYAALSAMAIIPVFAGFWWITKHPRREVGLVVGNLADYKWILLHPLFCLGIITAAAWLAGEINTTDTDWGEVGFYVLAIGLSNALIALFTEEGFYRGWLWAALGKIGPRTRLVITTIPFMLLHVSFATLEHEFALPLNQLAIYLVGAVTLGLIWGMMRQLSGSIVMTSLAHGLWNGLVYPLFGIGTHEGDLGIQNIDLFGPERGMLGLGLNVLFAIILWRVYEARLRQQDVVQS